MSVNWAQLYADLSAQLQAHVDLPFYQDFFVNFYRAFIDGARWKLYLSGLRMTIEVTVLALIMGIILGVIVAVIRTAHDQQRPGRHNPIAYVAEIIRGGLMSLDPGQAEAGRSLGLNYFQTMRFIVIPQAFKAILPALGNEFITLFKDTALITVIGGKELLYAAKAVGAKTYSVTYPYLGAAAMYLVLVIILTWLQGKLERRLRQSDRR